MNQHTNPVPAHEDPQGLPRPVGQLLDAASVVAAAAELLLRRFGGAPELGEIEELSGSGSAIVARARMTPSAFLPHRSVVVKYMPHTGSELDDAAFLREVVSYQFTTSLPEEVRPGPILLAHDVEQRILVLSDIGNAETFAAALEKADDAGRIHLLRMLGTKLGHMHAGTAGREQDFEVLLSRKLKKHPEYHEHQAARERLLLRSIDLGQDILSAAGLEPPVEFAEKAVEAGQVMLSGRSRAFTPFDLSPDNIVVGEQLHFLDYEWAGFRNVAFDVACVIAGFPQFLFARPISDDEADVFISAWAREIEKTWPKYGDEEVLHGELVAALIGWALSNLTTLHTDGIDGLMSLVNGAEIEDVKAIESQPSLLRPWNDGPFSEAEVLIRQDLYETFEALGRFCARCKGPRCETVGEFAQLVAGRLHESK